MKHLKTFEEKNIFLEIIKKYIIVKSTRNDIPYYLLKINTVDKNNLIYSAYFYIDNENLITMDKKSDTGVIKFNDIKNAIAYIEYQTDDFEDAVKILNLTKTIEKYNI